MAPQNGLRRDSRVFIRPRASACIGSLVVECRTGEIAMFLFAKGTNFRITIASKSLEDIKLPEDSYKVDFELAKRYSEFVKEITRFALLGIAGYGFMIEHLVGARHLVVMARGANMMLVVVGLFLLVAVAGLGLYCGQLNKACLLMQVSILRLLQRRQADRWNNPSLSSEGEVEQWKIANENDLSVLRRGQAQNLTRAHNMQRVTVCLLVLGIVFTGLVFVRCLNQDASMPAEQPTSPGH
jgi:hypothetical protein